MRIDAHQHFWRYDATEYPWIGDGMRSLRRDFLPADLQPEMARVGFDACVAVQARQSLEETRWLLQLAASNSFICGVVGWVDLQAHEVEEQLRALAPEPKLVGIRHIAQSEPDDFLMRPAVQRGIALLARFGLPYDILIYPRQLAAATELVARFPEQRFVLDHLAKPEISRGAIVEWERDIRRLARRPNVYGKLSGLVTEADWQSWTPDRIRPYLEIAFDAFGAERLMIGSDWPVCTVAADYRRTMDVVIDYVAALPAAAHASVLGGTASRFWKLTVQESQT